jgi:hypothetical protein
MTYTIEYEKIEAFCLEEAVNKFCESHTDYDPQDLEYDKENIKSDEDEFFFFEMLKSYHG